MTRVLLIDQDGVAAERLARRCLEQDVAVVIVENVCEGVRRLATTPVALIVADLGRLRLGVRDQAAVFDHVAPGVPVIVTVGPDVPLETRAALEVGGFRVMSSPAEPADLLEAIR